MPKAPNNINTNYYWVPACGGTEVPFTKHGKEYIYLWNSYTKEHAYYCITDDLFLSQAEVDALLP